MTIVSQEELEAHKAAVAAAAAAEVAAADEAARQVIGTKAVRLAGATGERATYVNGVYEPTSEVSSGVTVYRKVGDAGRWLEYLAGARQWQVKPTVWKGKNGGCYAYYHIPAKCLPEECPVGQWKVVVDGTLVSQASITVSNVNQRELEAHKAAASATAEAARLCNGTTSVRLAGAMGECSGCERCVRADE